ncbi:MFS transporter [Paraburkholderia sprentiae]|uniref:Major facilitator superfamily (MFS) profile domain-containing protein n=1 Tax=Paraburkholderia sprentiae WSM5005 TaxID=754502 RepID=A0A1I9YMT0_9BURK|nr:MFS transporter [Paraburkholderia sprentiae]
MREFALTSVERGGLNSAVFWSYGLVQMPMGWIVDRYGVKWPYAICFVLWCVAAAATGMVTTLAALVVMRLLIGVAEYDRQPRLPVTSSNNSSTDKRCGRIF